MVRKLDLLAFAPVLHRGNDAGDNELEMSRTLDPFRFVLIAVAGWMNQQQLHIIDYLREENRELSVAVRKSETVALRHPVVPVADGLIR